MEPTPLRKHLDKTGLSCRQFATLAGLDYSYVSRLVRGERRPGLVAAFAIEQATRGAIPVKAWRRAT